MDEDIRFVRDRMDISNLLSSYGHHADHRNHTAFIALFTRDARIDVGIPGVSDPKSLEAMMQAAPAEPGVQTRHSLTNLYIAEQSAERARGAIYLTFSSSADNVLNLVMTGEYRFTARRTQDGWRISDWAFHADGVPA